MATAKGERKEDTGKAAKRAARKGKGREQEGPINTPGPSKAVPSTAPNDHSTPWNWSYLADPQVSKHPPVFTKDAKYFFVAVSSLVKIYSSTTGKIVSTLRSHSRAAEGHSDRITCLMVNPQNSFQLFTGSADGTLRTWDFIDAVLLRTIDVGNPISYICAHEKIEDYVFATIQKPNKKKGKDEGGHTSVVIRVCLKTSNSKVGTRVQKSSELLTVGKAHSVIGMRISASGKWLTVAGGSKIYVAPTSSLKSGFTKFVCPEKLTCFASHPAEDWLATGDETGQIRLWYCLKDDLSFESAREDKTAPTTTLRWHAHAIRAIEFTPNGAYLLSGGEESVLVIWQLHTGKKEFVPRVGAPINTISVCDTGDGVREQEYLLGLDDGTLAFIRSSTLKLARTVARVRLEPSHVQHRSAPPLVMQPRSQNIILPSSHPSSIQIYSPLTASLVAEVEISPSNRVSRPFRKQLNPSRVELIAISDCVTWLATIDMRDGSHEGMGLDIFLKIWQWDQAQNSWDLNTKIDRPHGSNKVHSLVFSPTHREVEPLLASSGGDGNVKTWHLRRQTEKDSEQHVYWGLRTSFFYRSQQPGQVIWSRDGSILAVAHGCFVTLWSVETNALYRLFTSAEIHNFTRLTFVGRSGRYLCGAGNRGIALFDLIRGQPVYVVKTSFFILGLLSWLGKDEFAVIYEPTASESQPISSTLFSLYTPFSSEPVRIHSIPFRIKQSIAWETPESAAQSLPGIVALTYQGGLVHVGDNPIQYKEEGHAPTVIDPSAGGPSQPALFQDMFGKSAVLDFSSNAEKSTVAATTSSNQRFNWNLLDGPSHLLPSMQSLFLPLMQSMMQESPPTDPQSIAGATANEDDMVVDTPERADGHHTEDSSNGRLIDSREIDSFVALFQDAAFTTARPLTDELTSSTLTGASGAHHHLQNGKVKSNGVPTTNGSGPQVKSALLSIRPATTNGVVSPSFFKSTINGQPPSPPPREPSPQIGKKRKKAMMA